MTHAWQSNSLAEPVNESRIIYIILPAASVAERMEGWVLLLANVHP